MGNGGYVAVVVGDDGRTCGGGEGGPPGYFTNHGQWGGLLLQPVLPYKAGGEGGREGHLCYYVMAGAGYLLSPMSGGLLFLFLGQVQGSAHRNGFV